MEEQKNVKKESIYTVMDLLKKNQTLMISLYFVREEAVKQPIHVIMTNFMNY